MPIDTWTSDCSLGSGVKRSNAWKDFGRNQRSGRPARCLAASQRSATPTTETCRIPERTTRCSLTKSCPSCCLLHDHCDLNSVAPVVVMCHERKFPVSSPSYHNHYQFSSRADSDMSNASWLKAMTQSLRCSGSIPRGSSLTRQEELVLEVRCGRTTSIHTNRQVLPKKTPLPGPTETRLGKTLLPTTTASVDVPMAPPSQPIRNRSKASPPLLGRVHLSTL